MCSKLTSSKLNGRQTRLTEERRERGAGEGERDGKSSSENVNIKHSTTVIKRSVTTSIQEVKKQTHVYYELTIKSHF